MSYGNYVDLEKVKKVLVVKLRHLGDVLLATPVFSSLKSVKDFEIDAYIYKDSYEVLKDNPYINDFFIYDRDIKTKSFLKKVFYEYEILKKIKKKKYDLVINLTEGDRGAIVCNFSKARYRVGFDSGKKGFCGKNKLYSHVVKSPKTKRHSVEKNLDAIRRIGIFPEEKKLFFKVSNEVLEKVKKSLFEKNIDDFVLIHPSSRWKFKCWNKFHLLIEKLEKMGKKVVVSSSKDKEEQKMVDDIIKNTKAIKMLGSIEEFGALICLSEVLVCIDSFAFHLANALKQRVVALFGPTDDITWGAWENPLAKIITHDISCRPCGLDGCGGSKYSDCLNSISAKDVFNATV